ncbi:hypothetical protein CKM354_000794100 [Cercospora kikuchii]|uniref:Endo-1,4-beta-xylanase n=1 Tax=Cercospora kikuchii TaxID=84275 RepID=A0A9P3CLY2_9PEZI|nr:uncharacterized protein CKM354_000794100 [Cercospora kikuchii]GIZ44751.1 hypothetical protein CKM354_000794100 [Cercospora kikuchii]
MKFPFAALLSAAGAALAAPASLEERATLNYVQNYNGAAANFKYNQGAGTYSLNWNGNTDVVVGLGWTTGSARTINFSGTYNPGSSGSYYTVYGWLNSPLTEYYIVESYGSFNPCTGSGVTQQGSVTSDGSSYQVCTHTQVNQPSIVGTATFTQFFSVRQSKRTSGSVTTANHFKYWATKGFGNGNFNYQVFATEAFSGSGSASVTVS